MPKTSFRSRRDLDRRQLLLFSESPAPPPLPADPRDLFRELNERFFEGRLHARVVWSERLTASAGSCQSEDRLIRLSRPYHRRQPDALPVTLAHEMCHLLVPGHGPEFRELGARIARALRVTWQEFRYAQQWADLSRYRYVYKCLECGAEFPSRKRRRVSCARCSPGPYRERFRMVLTESRARPGPVLRGERPARPI